MKTLLTDRALRGLKPAPAGKRTVIWDSAVPSFCVRVTDTGAASFNVMRRLPNGRLIRRLIGFGWTVPFPAGHPLPYALADARADARAAILDISRGIDPKAKREAAKEADVQAAKQTFGAVAKDFFEDHVAGLRSAAEVEAAFRREILPSFGKRPVASITDLEIAKLLKAVAKDRPYQARHLFAYLSKFYRWALAQRCYGLAASPCAALSAKDLIGKPSPRVRVLTDSELAALWKSPGDLSYPTGPFVRLLLLTGQRLREVGEMAWSEIDLAKGLWVIPADRMKADTAHIVPLAPEAIAILADLPRWRGPFVLTTTGGRRPIANFSGLKAKIDALIPDVAPWRFHDLRRTMRTGLSSLRIPDTVSELCIAHTQKGLHKVYDQHAYIDEKRQAFEAWANRIKSIVEPGDPTNVIKMREQG